MKIVIIGAGNVGTQLAIALTKSGLKPVQIFSRNKNKAVKLGFLTDSKVATESSDLEDADVYFLAVKDDAITEVASYPRLKNKFLVHTAGSVDMNVLSRFTKTYGVLYPLQTIKKTAELDFFEDVPLCLEASDTDHLTILKQIAEKISEKVYVIDSEQRLKVHIAAVFANNFVNHLFAIANKIAENSGVDKEILKPLIRKTFENVLNYNAVEIQTGPAIRNDLSTLEKHIKVLQDFNTEIGELYKVLTESIKKFYTKGKV